MQRLPGGRRSLQVVQIIRAPTVVPATKVDSPHRPSGPSPPNFSSSPVLRSAGNPQTSLSSLPWHEISYGSGLSATLSSALLSRRCLQPLLFALGSCCLHAARNNFPVRIPQHVRIKRAYPQATSHALLRPYVPLQLPFMYDEECCIPRAGCRPPHEP